MKFVTLANGTPDGRLHVASRDGHLYLLRLADGTEAWSADIGSAISSSPAVADGMVVFGADDGRVYAYR